MAEWIARVYREGKGYRVVVEGVLDFAVESLDQVEEQTADAILKRLRMSYPKRALPWGDPTAERVMEFEVAVLNAGRKAETVRVVPWLWKRPWSRHGREPASS
ncbi:MAG: hypothetical protein WB809_04070 [Thermoplasmata archaeon]